MSDRHFLCFKLFFRRRVPVRCGALDAHADASTIDRPIAPAFVRRPPVVYSRVTRIDPDRSIDRTHASFKGAIQFVEWRLTLV